MYAVELRQRDPIDVAEALLHLPYPVFLDSALHHKSFGRYSFVAADPFGVFAVDGHQAYWDGTSLPGTPLDALKTCLAIYKGDHDPALPPLQGGAIGWIAYEFGHSLETLPEAEDDAFAIQPVCLPFYDVIIAFDHHLNRCWLLSTGWPEKDATQREVRARNRGAEFLSHLNRTDPGSASGPASGPDLSAPHHNPAVTDWQSNVSRKTYETAVQRTIDYILAGDIFQANITQRFLADEPEDFNRWAYYKHLRSINAAPFSAFLDFAGLTVASSSPERFLKVSGSNVETRPIKGTIRRDDDPERDEEVAQQLVDSEKDQAENVMIVDLLRNDLSRVCKPCSVKVPTLCGLETYASVHHLVSVVEGRLRDDKTAIDLLGASFPGGSITGAPKVRAMEIITELEGLKRTLYCGSIGYFSFTGQSDTSIVIRTALFSGGKIAFHAGGGITALSNPAQEYEESLTKAQRLFRSFEADNRGCS